jgi:ferritin-like metal-binding protein YciE
VDRLKQVLTSLDEKPTGKKCAGITGILQEGEELMEEDYEGSVMDAALISAAQRVEHYEIAAYGCVHAWAKELGEVDAAELLEQTLNEEKETDAKLTKLSGQINSSAKSDGTEETDEEESEPSMKKGKSRTANA